MAIFKYGSSGRLDVIENGRIRCTPPAFLNDPFELRPYIARAMPHEDLVRYYVKRWPAHISRFRLPAGERARLLALSSTPEFAAKARRSFARQFEGYDDHLREWLNSKIGILSFGGTVDNVLMWSYYGDNHRGMAFEFDDSHPWFDGTHPANPRFCKLLPVEYRPVRPAIDLSKLDQMDLFFVKAEYWRHEHESRVIWPLEDAAAILPRADGDVHLFDFPPEALRAVYCGALMRPTDREAVVRAIRERPAYAHVAIRQMTISKTVFAVHAVDIP